MQLVANGAQDVFLTNDPQITFWKRSFKRHTNFSMEAIPQTFTGSVQFGTETNCQITRSGDLIHKAWLEVTLPKLKTNCGLSVEDVWSPYVGELLVEWVNISIGGQVIDKHYGEWLHIWNELTSKNLDGYGKMVGKSVRSEEPTLFVPLVFWWNNSPGMALPLIALQYHEVRLNFKFNELNNLLSSKAMTAIGTSNYSNIFQNSSPSLNAKVYIDYVYIDMDERTRFAQSTHEYLIQQVQKTSESVRSENMRINLNFNHPCKELIWMVVDQKKEKKSFEFTYSNPMDEDADLDLFVNQLTFGSNASSGTVLADPSLKGSEGGITFDFGNDEKSVMGKGLFDRYSSGINLNNVNTTSFDFNKKQTSLSNKDNGNDEVSFRKMVQHVLSYDEKVNVGPVKSALVKLNNHERFCERPGSYFNLVQPYQHHTNVPRSAGIYSYSFALEPESDQPTGTCNFSRIDNAVLELKLDSYVALRNSNYKVNVYATNFNVLRIMGGMGGIAFAN